ncbi:MAG: pyrrolysine--tRNA(Pyl) ligase large subunit [Deltaproteobacteria bacterium]|jgi:phenylalanyl-tRNA synthetase alpha chain|nr:pyrrolysine--tRNA(Pyl) ligase large subunit [Deltaproteobacteria bacterium]
MDFSNEQVKRLCELGADPEGLPGGFASKADANRSFQSMEKSFARACAEGVRGHLKAAGRPEISLLRERLSGALAAAGFTEVATPLSVSRNFLERMGIGPDHPLSSQIFWLDKNRAVRPMLAPNLYYLMVDLLRLAPLPVSIFEIGTCMRRETKGARHAEEFTMLNLAEFGLPLEARQARILELADVVLAASGLPEGRCALESEESGVYGETLDVVSPEGLELASTAMGPHPLDSAWGVGVPWVGLGFGLERLAMALSAAHGVPVGLSRAGASLSYLGGFRLNVPGREDRA